MADLSPEEIQGQKKKKEYPDFGASECIVASMSKYLEVLHTMNTIDA